MKKCKPTKIVNNKTREVVSLADIPRAEPNAANAFVVEEPKIVCDWLCKTHNREATAIGENGVRHCVGPGILSACKVVWNGEGPAPLPYNPAFIADNNEEAAKFFQCG